MKNFKKQFGGKITPELEGRYKLSKNWKKGKFENLIETNLNINFWEIPELIYKQLTHKEKREPINPLAVLAFDGQAFLEEDSHSKFIWYGHSVILMQMNSKTILIDPMFGSNASPIAPYKTARFSDNTLDLIDDFPAIDLMLISHDHYDHLDYDSIQKLKDKTKQYYVALGIKRHLVKWGVDEEKIQEFDWWNSSDFFDIKITYTPTRHFSGRGLTDRSKSLWGGWNFKTAKENIWFSGDGGYGEHFKEIGNRLGPFDFAFMECGQYNEKWRPIHLFPQESVQAALEAQVKKAMPVHWAGFALSHHSWTEPAEEFSKYAKMNQLNTMFPRLGQLSNYRQEQSSEWWTKT